MDSIPRPLVITHTPDISSICPRLRGYRSLSDKATEVPAGSTEVVLGQSLMAPTVHPV